MGKLNFYKSKDKKNEILDTWKILISDDELDVHTLTKTVLKNFVYKGKGLEFISTFSGEETIEVVKNNDDIVLLLLDVIMESDDAGLQVVKTIRDDLNNHDLQIVLRTGQSGLVPESEVVMDYAINDYKEKTELTSKKLITTIITAIRSFENIKALNKSNEDIKKLNYDLNGILDSFDKYVIASRANKDGEIIYVSEAFCNLTGYRKDELLGNNHNILKDMFTPNEIYDDLWKTITSNKVWRGQIRNQKKNGEYYWLKTVISPEYDVHGEFVCYTAISQNITAQKEVEKANVEIEQLNEDIIETQREVVFRLGAIAEARDKETGMHVKRVAEYSKLLALYYGLPANEAEIVKMASPMHDIGKVAIPDDILKKPGRYTPEEFEIMKTHAQIGYDMLKSSNKPILKAAAIIAHQHQEKYDGSGYPQGLSGEDIHIYGRITAIADVFDALGSDRVYKKAWDDDRIFNLFKEERAKHFDPVLIDLFFKNLDNFLEIRDKFKDV
ncbi:HD domain-containing phosphohydrolase [Arcobacter roscoffensis]|uniref:HD domain-containing protein n=1 Tax=Arcobacter roscoffensis TaxID=2961520 RepID=A0ABY5E7W4_9BACT|nr:HD domain-containing phosphohydrolase [Arcobacter roscoffensis]UTJ07614.1 HD domain-containing protein [Arcobacter roscoffensis]